MSTSTPEISSETNHFSILDPPGYIEPSLQDMLLTDINPETLLMIAKRLDVENLSPATAFPGTFPVEGIIYGPNRRLMVNLVCRRRGEHTQPINVVFLIDTGSPVSYVSERTMGALLGDASGSNVPRQLSVMIHTETTIECTLSPLNKHFADVNVLGADFLVENGLALKAKYRSKICTLMTE